MFYKKKLNAQEFESVYMNLTNIGVDVDNAMKFIEENFKDISNYAHSKNYFTLLKIETQDIYFSRSNNGRLNTVFTTLKRELKQFLFDRVDGSFDFVEVDISNAQPLLVTIYMENNYSEVRSKPDFLKWKELCQSGTIYDYIAENLNSNRDFVKERFMDVLLFTKNGKSHLLKGKNLCSDNIDKKNFILKIKDLFPTIWEILLKIKKEITNSEFAIRIQKMEAELMIDTVLVNLKEIGTHFSIHDSIVCRTHDVGFVSEQIRTAFTTLYNYSVNLKFKKLY
jgi:hypothetical protein